MVPVRKSLGERLGEIGMWLFISSYVGVMAWFIYSTWWEVHIP